MSVELYNKDRHVCVAFRDLVSGEAVQANQFLIFDSDHAALIDPGGDLTYTALFMGISHYLNVKHLDYVVASHQDPDIVASLNKWLVATDCKVVVPALWERFIPHFTRPGKLAGRVVAIPDPGMNLQLGSIQLKAIPAHFLHAEGNFQFYDPRSRILFSGDLGANLCPADELDRPAKKLDEVLPYMEGFHKRYMNSNQVCRYWARMVADIDITMIAPQHGRPLVGKAVAEFIRWISELQCGVDLMTQSNYKIPG
ncbi:MAG: MBL fold metallo-hydrolase [Chromatiaceae bacterium]|nr:MBL fold metallo-hydrolase [Gammaproteobacteria bacterium]MCP5300594.1 MBL fold metallo-hydrolase [Chromatiaceae bacterium]MCP5422666.1 MBL fold metallo-hydrolase [Chromatiaceae bacterium]